jgi:hypothetical protein
MLGRLNDATLKKWGVFIRALPPWVSLPISIGVAIALVIVAQAWSQWKFGQKIAATNAEQTRRLEAAQAANAAALSNAVEQVLARADTVVSNRVLAGQAQLRGEFWQQLHAVKKGGPR